MNTSTTPNTLQASRFAHAARLRRSLVLLTGSILSIGCSALPASLLGTAHADEPLVADEGWTSSVHERHAGEIVFSNRPINRGKPSEKAFIKNSKLGQDLYLRVLMDGSFENAFRKKGKRCSGDKRRLLRVILNDDETFLEAKAMHEADWNDWTNFPPLGDGPLTRKPSFGVALVDGLANENQIAHGFWTDLAPRLKAGKNTLRFEAVADCNMGIDRVIVATGELKMQVDAKSKAKLVSKNRPSLPKSTMKKLHGGITKAMQRKWPIKVYDIAVTSSTWSIERHPIHGHPVKRSISGWTVTDEPKEGCSLMSFTVSQLANGKSYHKNFSSEIFTGSGRAFPCK